MNLKNFKYKKRNGFTLVEMVIVVTVLGILSGLGFTQFNNVQVISKKNADYIAASNLATAANLFLSENPDIFTINKDDNSKVIDTKDLKTKGYISSIPKSQSKGKDFIIKIVEVSDGTEKSEQLRVVCEGESSKEEIIFYPKQE